MGKLRINTEISERYSLLKYLFLTAKQFNFIFSKFTTSSSHHYFFRLVYVQSLFMDFEVCTKRNDRLCNH